MPLNRKLRRVQRQRGISLPELMISLLIGLIVMGALLDTYLGITAAGRDARTGSGPRKTLAYGTCR